jgi:hypothetical protein
MRRLGAISVVFGVLLAVFFSAPSLSAEYRVGGRWRTDGGGFAEKGFVRISLSNSGVLTLRSTMDGDVERITGYNMYGELRATGFNINAWRQSDDHDYAIPIEVDGFNPSMSDPFVLPSFTIDKLTYTVSLTSVNSGTVRLRGYVDIDGVGECEVNADNAIWREGTPRPSVPETESGCASGTGSLPLALYFILRKTRKGRAA